MSTTENKPHRYELADILREHFDDFLTNHTLCTVQHKAIRDIISCRTSRMKGHLSRCNNCGYREQSYNSCRNRHCNKCQFLRQAVWADKTKARLLPGKYFHLVFTIPDSLNPLFYLNQQKCYNLIFSIAWSAVKDLCMNPQFMGAQTGAIAILHTWSSTMKYHPHIHMLVPAGGLSDDGMEWVKAKNNFLVPVKLLSRVYRARFCDQLKKLIDNNELLLPDKTDRKILFSMLFKKQWVVYAKKTGKSADKALEYLARYTNRVAITNQRITGVCKDKVSFRYKDTKTGKYNREMTLDADEFIRRFIKHILPCRFYKIRYFGIFASANCKDKMEQSMYLTGESMVLSHLEGLNSFEVLQDITGKDPLICKICKKGRMIPVNLENTG